VANNGQFVLVLLGRLGAAYARPRLVKLEQVEVERIGSRLSEAKIPQAIDYISITDTKERIITISFSRIVTRTVCPISFALFLPTARSLILEMV